MANFKYLGVDINRLIEKEDVPDFRVEKFLIWYKEEFPCGVNSAGILEEAFRFICFKGYIAGVADKYVDASLLTPPPTVEYSPNRNKLWEDWSSKIPNIEGEFYMKDESWVNPTLYVFEFINNVLMNGPKARDFRWEADGSRHLKSAKFKMVNYE